MSTLAPGMKTAEETKALVLEAFDTLFNKRDYAKAAEFWSENFNTMAVDIFTVKNGKLATAYHVENWVGALQQLSK